VARRRWWRGRAVVVMNAQTLGKWDMAPRAHPGDGRLDSISGQLNVRQRVLAGRLARTGGHLPHPALTQKRAPAFEFEFANPRSLWLDGARVGQCRSLRIEIASTIAVAV
jgi:diacylglycerol kinase family enzyme